MVRMFPLTFIALLVLLALPGASLQAQAVSVPYRVGFPLVEPSDVLATSDNSSIRADFEGVNGISYFMKLSPEGRLVWYNSYEGIGSSARFVQLAEAANGDYLAVGTDARDEITVLRLDSAGRYRWHTAFGADAQGTCVLPTTVNGTVVAGSYIGTRFLAELNESGEIRWGFRYRSEVGRSVHVALARTVSGGYVTVANVEGGASLLRTDIVGQVVWTKLYEAFGRDVHIRSVLATSDGGFLLTGKISEVGVPTWFDALVMKVDSKGEVEWARTFEDGRDDSFVGAVQIWGHLYAITSTGQRMTIFRSNGDQIRGVHYPGNVGPPHLSADGGYTMTSSSEFFESVIKTDRFGWIGCEEDALVFFGEAPFSADSLIVSDVTLAPVTIVLDELPEKDSITVKATNRTIQRFCYGEPSSVPGEVAGDDLVTMTPNPPNGPLRFRLNIPTSGVCHIDLYDGTGRRVAVIAHESFPAGEREVVWESGGWLPSGVYYYQVLITPSVGPVLRQTGSFVVER